jgi:hypothetical protein
MALLSMIIVDLSGATCMQAYQRLPTAVALMIFTVAAVPTCPSRGADETPAAVNAEFSVSVGQRQLFLDDQGVRSIENLRRTMHRPQKRGAVLRSPNPNQTLQTRTAPVWDPQAILYKLWVLGIDQSFWQSADGLNWAPGPKPNLRIDMAVYDPCDSAPLRRFKAPLLDSGFAVSPDGIQWTQLDLRKIPSSDEGNFSYLPEDGIFIHTVKRGGRFGRSVALATSPDFAAWTDFGIVFQADERDQELGKEQIKVRMADATLQQTFYNDPTAYNVDVYNMGVFRYESHYIGLPAMYHAVGPIPNYPNTDGFHLIQLTCSHDLKTWQRLGDRQNFIGPSRLDSGAYDLTQILPPSAPVVRDDELWFYYTGLKYRSTFTYVGTYPNGETRTIPGRDRDTGAVCLAVLRRDGFVSLDADVDEGQISTQAFALAAGKLHVNVDAHSGELQVEVLDQEGQVVAESEVIKADLPQTEIVWREGGLAKVQGQMVSLRFKLRNAGLYSYWMSD